MAAGSVLEGKSAVGVSGNVSAGATPSNFTIQGTPADVANYARQGSDLVVQMKNGQTFTIQNFSAQGMGFNNLVFAQGETVSVVNFSRAASALGDGIIDALVTTQVVGAGVSTTTLLGILGAAAAAGGVAVAVSENNGEKTTDPIDTIAPAAPTNISLSQDTGASSADNVTNSAVQIFSGKAEAGATVKVTITGLQSGAQLLGIVTADADGNWSIESTIALSDDTYTVTATGTDAAGNVSEVSAPLEFVLDTTIGDPTDLSIANGDGVTLDPLTNVNALVFTGEAEANSVVELFLNEALIGTATAGTDGKWQFDHTGNSLADDEYTLVAKATDLAGNVSNIASYSFEIDTTTPAPFQFIVADAGGDEVENGVIQARELVFSGVAEADSEVELLLNGTLIGVAQADADGKWEFDYTGTPLDYGNYELTARATDRAGNISPISAAYIFVVEPEPLTATITGNGGSGGLITFVFSEAIDPTSFTEADIVVANGQLDAGSLTQVDSTTWTVNVTPAMGSTNTNVAVTLLEGGVQTAAGKLNQEARNETSLDSLFWMGSTLSGDYSNWDTSHATSAISTFNSATVSWEIGGWDVSNVTTMEEMFNGALTFNRDIGSWNVGKVTNMSFMFGSNYAFNQDIGDWNTGAVTNMNGMFYNATVFNQNIGGWDVSNVVNMDSMFRGAAAFDQDIGGWSVSNVTTMKRMFENATAFDQDIGDWDVSNVTDMDYMFCVAAAFNQDIGDWDVSNVTTMSNMFVNADAFNQAISGWNTSAVTNMSFMFTNADVFNQDISGWNTSAVVHMAYMFQLASDFDQNLGGWDISALTNAASMFTSSGMSVENMDKTLRGWAKLDTAAGETAIQNNVTFGVATYSDATAVQYLKDHYNWTIAGALEAGVLVGANDTDDSMDYGSGPEALILHGLGGNDTIYGADGDDWIVGGAGDDILTGRGGADTFHYGFKDAGNDMITDFSTGEGDVLHLADLLVGYDAGTSTLSDFIFAEDNTFGGTLLTIDYDGSGAANDLVRIELANVAYTATLLDDLISGGNLVLA